MAESNKRKPAEKLSGAARRKILKQAIVLKQMLNSAWNLQHLSPNYRQRVKMSAFQATC